MFLSNLSIRRPVVATVMMLTLVTLGVFSLRRLPIDMMPDVEIPVLSIITEYPGASPETVEREVSRKIEEAVNPIAGVKHVNSISREGLSSVIVEFNLEVKVNDVSQEARAKINAVRRELPEGMKEPVIQKFDFNAMPVVNEEGKALIDIPLSVGLVGALVKPKLVALGASMTLFPFPLREMSEVVADKAYHSNDRLVDLADLGIRTYISEPKRGRRRWRVGPRTDPSANEGSP